LNLHESEVITGVEVLLLVSSGAQISYHEFNENGVILVAC